MIINMVGFTHYNLMGTLLVALWASGCPIVNTIRISEQTIETGGPKSGSQCMESI